MINILTLTHSHRLTCITSEKGLMLSCSYVVINRGMGLGDAVCNNRIDTESQINETIRCALSLSLGLKFLSPIRNTHTLCRAALDS